jgi:hypothetical protein
LHNLLERAWRASKDSKTEGKFSKPNCVFFCDRYFRKLQWLNLTGKRGCFDKFYLLSIKKNKTGGAFGLYGGQRGAYRFWWGDLIEGDHLENLSVDGRIILK